MFNGPLEGVVLLGIERHGWRKGAILPVQLAPKIMALVFSKKGGGV